MEKQTAIVQLTALNQRLDRLVNVPALNADTLRSLPDIAAGLRSVEPGAQQGLYLKLIATTSELFEHFDRNVQAREVLALGREHINTLPPEIPDIDLDTRRFVREQVRFQADAAFSELYRGGKFDAAWAQLESAATLLHLVRTPSFPCLQTFGHVLVLQSFIAHRRGASSVAVNCLQRALEFYAEKAELQVDPAPGTSVHWLRHRAAQVLLALGHVFYGQGLLNRALSCASAARLSHVHVERSVFVDDLTHAFVTLLRVAIKRSLEGQGERQLLNQMVGELKQAAATFESYQHRTGLMRARYELALTYMYLDDQRDLARECLEQVRTDADTLGDHQWACYALSRLSRLVLAHSVTDALSIADVAFALADEHGLRMCQIDALLQRADALLRASETARARNDLRRVLEYEGIKSGANPRLALRCQLLMARSHVLDNNRGSADEWIGTASRLLPAVEHKSLQVLHEAVVSERDKLGGDFRIRPSADLDYHAQHRRLRRWLLEQARKTASTDQAVADRLHVTRMTLSNWESELRTKEPRRRKPSLGQQKSANHKRRK